MSKYLTLALALISLDLFASPTYILSQAELSDESNAWSMTLPFTSAEGKLIYRIKSLPASKGAFPRYFIDISPLKLSRHFKAPQIENNRYFTNIRWGQFLSDTVRIVFDLRDPLKEEMLLVQWIGQNLNIRVNKMSIEAPKLEVVSRTPLDPVIPELPSLVSAISNPSNITEIVPEPTQVPDVSKTETQVQILDIIQKMQAKKIPAPINFKRIRIIVDPGHGGVDGGAHGPTGVLEKDVTLAISKKLIQRLDKDGSFEVFTTRENDDTLKLLDRTEFANQKKGDLFVSIHANASPRKNAKGISTYFLNNTDDQESLRVAMRENGELDPDQMGKGMNKNSSEYYLEVMKASMTKNFHTDKSTDLAESIQHHLVKNIGNKFSSIENLGVRNARFYVLTGATMPAVLVETSFISNPVEEKRLKSKDYQEEMAEAIYQGILHYFEKSSAQTDFLQKIKLTKK